MINFTLSDQFWRRLNFLIGLVSFGVLFGLVTFFSSIEIKDLDLWLHLGTGKYITQHGQVPHQDVLSCSIAGKPWVNHEWLFQVLVYHVQKCWGFDGLIMMQSLVVVLTFFILLLMRYDPRRQWLTVFLLLLCLLVYQSRFTIRPDIFSLLFMVSFIGIGSKWMHQRWALITLVFIQVLWVNMHGFFLFGPILIGALVVGEFLKRRLTLPFEWNQSERLTDAQYSGLKNAALLLPLACLINPYFIKGAIYPLTVFTQLNGDSQIFFKHIFELQKPITQGTFFTTKYSNYKALIVLSTYSFLLNRRRLDISSLLVWGIMLVFSLSAIRNLVFFAVVAFLAFMGNVKHYPFEHVFPFRFSGERFKNLTGMVGKALIIFWMINQGLEVTTNGYFDFETYRRKSEFWGISQRSFPYKAVDFLEKNKIKGNFFNDFNSGAYLVGRVYPNIHVYIDGRTEVYGPKFFKDYLKIWREGDEKLFEEKVQKYNITGIFLNSAGQEIPERALRMFYGLKGWSVIYFDFDGIIFLKQIPENSFWIERFGFDLKTRQARPMDLYRLGTSRVDPFPFVDRARGLKIMGLYDQALSELRLALDVNPGFLPAYKMMGEIYGIQKKYDLAFKYLRAASSYAPSDIKTRCNVAATYEHLGDYRRALEQFQKAKDYGASDAGIYFHLARVYARLGQYKKSLEYLKQGRAKDSKDKDAVNKIRDVIINQTTEPDILRMFNEVMK